MTRPLVVLVHGTRQTRHEWDGYAELLPGAELLAIDLPGHGSRAGERCTREAAMAAIHDAVRSRDDGQPVVLVGHSLGGYLAALYMEESTTAGRDDVDALVLVGTTADPASPVAGVYRGFAKILPIVGFERMTTIANVFYRALGERGELPGPESYEALDDAWKVVFADCGPRNLEPVRAPVTIVNGQFDQMRLHARRWAAASGNATVHLVPGATHLLPITHKPQLAAILAEVAAATG